MGALPEQPVEFTFGEGIHENEDSWLQTQGFTRLENCFQDRDGSVIKQPGTSSAVVTVTNRSDFAAITLASVGNDGKLVRRGNLLGVHAAGTLWAKTDELVQQGAVSPWVAELRTVAEVDGAVRADSCQSGDWVYTAYTFTDPATGSARIRVAVTYAPTSETVEFTSAIGSAAASFPRLQAWNTTTGSVMLMYRVGTNLVYCQVTQETFGAETVLVAGTATDRYDFVTDVANSRMYLTFWDTATFVNIQKYQLNASTVTSLAGPYPSAAVKANLTAICCALNSGSGRLLVAWSRWVPGTNQRVSAIIFDSAFPTDYATSTVIAETALWNAAVIGAFPGDGSSVNRIGAVRVANDWYVTWHDQNLSAAGGEFAYNLPTQRGAKFSSAGAVGTLHFCGLVGMRSRPWWDGQRIYMLVSHATGPGTSLNGGTDANSYHAIIGIEPDTANLTRFRPFGFFSLAQAELTDLYRMTTPYIDTSGFYNLQMLENDPGVQRTRVREVKLCIDDRVGIAREFGDQTYFTGAMLWAWDGIVPQEAGFLQDPYPVDGVTQVAGSLDAGTRYYKVTYSRTSNTGELLRSAPSASSLATNTGAQDNRITVLPLMLSAASGLNPSPYFVEVWRTRTGETTPFFLVKRQRLDPNSRVAITFTDSIEDANLPFEFQTTLYTDGSEGAELENDPPTSALHLTVWRNRLWITDGEQVAYTKEGALNRAAEFSTAQTIQRATPQRLTALGALGEALACFGQDFTGYIYGEGPASNGQGSSLAGPVLVQGEKGCTQPAALLEIRTGLLVRTRLGIESLSLKREWSWVGEAIENQLDATPRVRDATTEYGEDRAWFVLTQASGGGGTTTFAVLDLQRGVWSTLYPGFFGALSIRATQRELAWFRGSGIEVLNTGTWKSNGTALEQAIETPWFKPAGIMAEIRLRKMWLLAERFKVGGVSSGLKIEVAYNYETAYTHLVTLTSAQLAAMEGQTDAVKLRLSFARQRCTSFRLRFTEQTSGSDLPGFRFVACRFVVAARGVRGALLSTTNAGTGFA